ncbi:hypothetical protein [Vibrio crassostreae]|uniref:hypothetical protein n=1 Tax=Vibrio crassostreae TaxID=246167 RepID=UPI001B30E9FB|nr:hypothetical protein [Vibrio crassostreae]
MISDIEVKAEVFRVIRANSEKPAKTVYGLIKTHLEDTGAEQNQIQKALKELCSAECFE